MFAKLAKLAKPQNQKSKTKKGEDFSGLEVFIADIKACGGDKDKEDERVEAELKNIRNKFSSKKKKLSPYTRKKYICKLVFISLMNYELDFGTDHMLALIREKTYSEKKIGYLSASIQLPPNHPHGDETSEAIKADIIGNDGPRKCVALTYVGNAPQPQLRRLLGTHILKLFMSYDEDVNVRKKSCLALLACARENDDLIPHGAPWTPRSHALFSPAWRELVVLQLAVFRRLEIPADAAYCIVQAASVDAGRDLVDEFCAVLSRYFCSRSPGEEEERLSALGLMNHVIVKHPHVVSSLAPIVLPAYSSTQCSWCKVACLRFLRALPLECRGDVATCGQLPYTLRFPTATLKELVLTYIDYNVCEGYVVNVLTHLAHDQVVRNSFLLDQLQARYALAYAWERQKSSSGIWQAIVAAELHPTEETICEMMTTNMWSNSVLVRMLLAIAADEDSETKTVRRVMSTIHSSVDEPTASAALWSLARVRTDVVERCMILTECAFPAVRDLSNAVCPADLWDELFEQLRIPPGRDELDALSASEQVIDDARAACALRALKALKRGTRYRQLPPAVGSLALRVLALWGRCLSNDDRSQLAERVKNVLPSLPPNKDMATCKAYIALLRAHPTRNIQGAILQALMDSTAMPVTLSQFLKHHHDLAKNVDKVLWKDPFVPREPQDDDVPEEPLPWHSSVTPADATSEDVLAELENALQIWEVFTAVTSSSMRASLAAQTIAGIAWDISKPWKVSGLTLLHLAACTGDAAIVQLLLDAGADPNRIDSEHGTPLHVSVRILNIPVSRKLAAVTDLSLSDPKSGTTPRELQAALKASCEKGTSKSKRLRRIGLILDHVEKKAQTARTAPAEAEEASGPWGATKAVEAKGGGGENYSEGSAGETTVKGTEGEAAPVKEE